MTRTCAICAVELRPDNQTQTCTEDKLLLQSDFYDDRELWVPVAGFDGYEISSQGRVRSIDRIVIHKDGSRHQYLGQLIKLWPQQRSGYLQVTFGRRGTHRVNRLMLSIA